MPRGVTLVASEAAPAQISISQERRPMTVRGSAALTDLHLVHPTDPRVNLAIAMSGQHQTRSLLSERGQGYTRGIPLRSEAEPAMTLPSLPTPRYLVGDRCGPCRESTP